MLHARIDGHATASIAHPSLRGQRLVLCTPLDETGADAGAPFAAIDPIGAGRHARVIVTTDGVWTQRTVGDDHSPLRNEVIGLIDETP